MHATRLAGLALLLGGCLNARVPLPPPPTTPAVQVPTAAEVTELEVRFRGGENVRIVTDRKTIQEFLAFVGSLDSGWVADLGVPQSASRPGWEVAVSRMNHKPVIYLFAGAVLSSGDRDRWGETKRERALNRDDWERVTKILDLKRDIREAGLE